MPLIINLIDKYIIHLFFLHLFFGLLASEYSIFATLWGWSLIPLGATLILKYKNRHNIAGIFTSYLTGLEIILRMTDARVFWEFGKYGCIVFLFLGLLSESIKQHRISGFMVVYILSLLPSILILETENFNYWRQAISFNLSGPFSLLFCFLYFRNRVFNDLDLLRIFKSILLPLISMSMICIIRAPALEDIVFGSEANELMSGGYGPNQVSSALGLVVTVIAISKILGYVIFKKDIFDYTILGICSIQAYLTLARGGVITAVLAIFTAWLISVNKSNSRTFRAGKFVYVVFILISLWYVAGDFTRGKMEQRYLSILNVDKSGMLSGSGRILIMSIDLKIFMDNLLLGVGPGAATQLRQSYGYNKVVTAHSEFTRSLAEHGVFGLLSIFALLAVVIKEYSKRRVQEKCLLACFGAIAILTMLHSAMRLTMPGFIFGLAFLRLRTIK